MKRDPNVEAYRLLSRFVPEFRRFIKGQLVVRHGAERWLDGVPGDVRQRLTQFEQNWGENPWVGARGESLLDFAYEEDLTRIITDDDNWKNVFRQWFGSDKRVIEIKLREMRWIRDQVAHFRLLDRDHLTRVRRLCRDVELCIARAAAIQADSEAPQRLLRPAELLAGDKDPAELLEAVQKRAAAARRGEMQGVTHEELAALERSLLDLIFEQGAYPDESGVEATHIHWRFDEWQRAPETEVLAWQVYAPAEPVPRGSTVYLAIRYNPAALRARPAVKRKATPRFEPRPQPGGCQIIGLRSGEVAHFGFDVDPQGWKYNRGYTPSAVGEYGVAWFGVGEDWRDPWARAEFVVRRRRRTTGPKQS